MAASALFSKKGVEMVHEWTGPGPVTRGNVCEAHRALYIIVVTTNKTSQSEIFYVELLNLHHHINVKRSSTLFAILANVILIFVILNEG